MKIFSRITIVILTILTGGFIYFITNFGPIISGFGAKAVCSCVYVGDRTMESAVKNELSAFPLTLGTFELNEEDQSATGSVFGFAFAKAIYRKGLGCTLVREKSEKELRAELPQVNLSLPVLSDTVYWPMGSRVSDTVPNTVNRADLASVVEKAFTNVNPKVPAKTRGIVVIYKGQLIYEKYDSEFNQNSAQLGWSMTKSVTNMMFGVMAQKGMFDIYSPAPVKEWEGDERAMITTDQLLRMSSGLYWEEVYSNVSTATNMLYAKADMSGFASGQKFKVDADSEWVYSSGSTNIAAKILRTRLGDNAYYNFAQNELFSKLGIATAVIEPDASGTFVGSSYMWASARDWARLGQLYLNKGLWNGAQIIPSSWVEYTIQPTSKAPKGEYGSQWWLNAGEKGNETNRLLPDVPTDMYMMDGYEGQRVFVVPSADLVVVRLGQNKKGGFDHNQFLSGVISSVQ